MWSKNFFDLDEFAGLIVLIVIAGNSCWGLFCPNKKSAILIGMHKFSFCQHCLEDLRMFTDSPHLAHRHSRVLWHHFPASYCNKLLQFQHQTSHSVSIILRPWTWKVLKIFRLCYPWWTWQCSWFQCFAKKAVSPFNSNIHFPIYTNWSHI